MSAVKTPVRGRLKNRRVRQPAAARSADACVLLGIEPSGKVAFCQVGDSARNADEQVTDSMLERYPNLAYVAIVPAQLQAVRSDTARLNRPR